MEKLTKCIRELCFMLTFPLAFSKPMGKVKLSDDEKERLNNSIVDMIWQSTFSKSFLVWRRRLLYSASIFYAVGAAIRISDIMEQCGGFLSSGQNQDTGAYVSSSGEELVNYSVLGKATLISQRIAPFCSLFVILVAAWFWTDYSKSRNILVPGWLLTLLLSLWPMMIPLNYLLNNSTLSENALLSATYAFGILPTYLSIIAGMTVGFKRVFAFAPSPLSGAMVVLSAVFAIIIPFAALAMIVQLLGDYLLVAGFCLLVLGPVIIVFGASLFTNPLTTFGSNEHIHKCGRLLLLADMCRCAGLVLGLAWGIKTVFWAKNYSDTTNEDLRMVADYILKLMDFKTITGMTFEFIGGMMFNAVLWTDIAVHVARNDDAKMKKMQSDLS